MPTKERLAARAQSQITIDLYEAAERSGYASETLRGMMFKLPVEERPPLVKIRGRWRANPEQLDAWVAERDRPQ